MITIRQAFFAFQAAAAHGPL